MSENPIPVYPQPPSGGAKIPILFGAVLALIASNVYLYLQLDKTREDITKTKDAFTEEISTVRQATSVSQATSKKQLVQLQDQLEGARRQATMATGQAKVDAEKYAEGLARRLEGEQKKAEASLTTKIGENATEAKAAIGAVSTEVGAVKTEVGSVKSDLGTTKSELDKTNVFLKSVKGDLDGTSQKVATNGSEISQLRMLGERNIFEFKLGKTKEPQKVGDITLLLKKTDTKKNKFSVELHADDKLTEKKDRSINEPLQFYTSKARQPYEIVVNEVRKDVIIGYLSTPKVTIAR